MRAFAIVRARYNRRRGCWPTCGRRAAYAGGAASGERDRLAERPEVRAKISEMMAAHWEHWVDQPLPILGNRTPMEAVKDPDGREIVESLVIQAERLGRSATLATDEGVYRRLRERLVSQEAETNRQGVCLQAAEQSSCIGDVVHK